MLLFSKKKIVLLNIILFVVACLNKSKPVGTNEITIVMPNSSSIPRLYYYCSAHPGMGGSIDIVEITSSAIPSSGGGGSSGPGY